MTPALQVVHTLAALAWADGSLAEQEAPTVRRFIAAFALADADRALAESWLSAPVGLDTANFAAMPEGRRLGMYQLALRQAAADDQIDAHERAMLERLRAALQLGEDQAAEIEAGLPLHD